MDLVPIINGVAIGVMLIVAAIIISRRPRRRA